MFSFQDISVAKTDLQVRAYSRILLQFKRSQVLLDVMGAIVEEVQALSDAIQEVKEGFIPAKAIGSQQDVLGRILGLGRDSGYRYEEIPRWVEEGDERETEDGQIRFLDTGVLPSQYQLSNYEFNLALAGKSFRNFCQFGSVPEIQEYFQIVFGLQVTPVIAGFSELTLHVPPGTDAALVAIIPRTKATNVTDTAFFAPYPATIELSVVVD